MSHLFSGRYGGLALHVVYFYLLTEECDDSDVKRLQLHLAIFWLARLISTQYRLAIPGNYCITVLSAHWQGYHLC